VLAEKVTVGDLKLRQRKLKRSVQFLGNQRTSANIEYTHNNILYLLEKAMYVCT